MSRRTLWLCATMLLAAGGDPYLAQNSEPVPVEPCTIDQVARIQPNTQSDPQIAEVSLDVVEMPAGPPGAALSTGDPQHPSEQLILDVTVTVERTKILPGSSDPYGLREAPFKVAVGPEARAEAAPAAQEAPSQTPLSFDVVVAGNEPDTVEHGEADPKATFKVTVVGTIPPRPPLLVPMYAAFIGVQSADGYFTWVGVRRHATEANPIVACATGNVFKLVGLKALTSASTIYFTERLRREHPRRALFLMAAINGALSWVAWHDAQVARKMLP